MNKIVITALLFLLGTFSTTFADGQKDNGNQEWTLFDLQERVSKLEKKNNFDIPSGFFINGELEGRYDDKTYDSGWDSRGEFQLGLQTNIEQTLGVNWIGTSATYDSYYELDHSQDNTLVEKQIGFGNDKARFYIGETDAQRLGFAKTPKISAPLIFTETNYRIDHREKTVLAFGGWEWDNEFDFDSYRLKRETPWGVSLGWDNDGNVGYATGTVSLMGYADLSYMTITGPEETTKSDQDGWSLGGSLHRFGVPMLWGVEVWDDKNTGRASKDRYDYGVMYNVTPQTYVTAHRTENDDLGYTGNYYGVVHNIYTESDKSKRPDKQDGLELGLYLHDKEQTSVYTGAFTDHGQQIIASIRYKF